ncbi:MAG TPA: TlpA disulfide reductase family protein [Pyrinomonadaceae bacterium]|nr:TlpA disulfide reductase family protein [Pyrinomonadaceae bacterium]
MKRFLTCLLLLFSFLPAARAQEKAVRVEGQVVCCAECWAEADRTKVVYGTAEDLLKAQSCVAGGDPTLVAVREGEGFKLYQLEQGKFRLPGKDWLEFVGRRVALTGAARKKGEANVFRVDALEVLAQSPAEREAANAVGREVELALKDLSGAEQRLSSLKGRVVVLNFWATYCVPCRKEMPDLAAIQNEYAALGVQVLGASADAPEERAKVLQFVKETKINFPVWTGATAADMLRFGLGTALPGTVVVGRDGKIVRVISGVVNQADLKKQIDAMLVNVEAASVREKPSEASTVPA